MPDYIYLLENRLSADQRHALTQLRTAARDAETILFLTGDAVRDLTSGHAVRDLEVSIHGNALKLKKPLEKLGAMVWGEHEPTRSLYLCFPGTVRVDVVSAHRVEYPKPGKALYHPASIQEDLRRRDFTVNSMAISLNEGSYGLLMDPLNGAADIEARILRLVSNYGFLEEPSLMIRATRFRARLGWEMDLRTQARYDNAKSEGVIDSLSDHARSHELEQIGHEEEGLKVLRALEAEGWMKVLFPAWISAKADEAKLTALHDLAVELNLQGVHPDISAAQMHLLTAKLPAKELSALKKALLRPGFVEEWNHLDALASGFQKVLLAKQNSKASATFKLFMSYDPEAILWLGFTSKVAAVQERYNLFLRVWPEARQRIPHLLMQEMRITPDLPKYKEILHLIFLELIDGHLNTPEEMRAFLEPHSPPAPPPQVTVKRARARRNAEAKLKERALEEDEDAEDTLGADDDLEVIGDDDEIDLGILPKDAVDVDDEDEEGDEDLEDGDEPAQGKKHAAAPGKKGAKPSPGKAEKPVVTAKVAAALAAPSGKPAVGKAAAQGKAAPAKAEKPAVTAKAGAAPVASSAKPHAGKIVAQGKAALAKPIPVAQEKKTTAAVAKAAKTAKKAPVPVKKVTVKKPSKPAPKAPAKKPVKKPVAAPAKRPAAKAAKPAGKKPAKSAKKR